MCHPFQFVFCLIRICILCFKIWNKSHHVSCACFDSVVGDNVNNDAFNIVVFVEFEANIWKNLHRETKIYLRMESYWSKTKRDRYWRSSECSVMNSLALLIDINCIFCHLFIGRRQTSMKMTTMNLTQKLKKKQVCG